MAEIDPQLFGEIQAQVAEQFSGYTNTATDKTRDKARIYFFPHSDSTIFPVLRIGVEGDFFTGEIGSSGLTKRGVLDRKTGYESIAPRMVQELHWHYSNDIPRSRKNRISQLLEALKVNLEGSEVPLPVSEKIIRSFIIMSPLRWAENHRMLVVRGYVASTDDPGFVRSLIEEYQAEGEKHAEDAEEMGILVKNEVKRLADEGVVLSEADQEEVRENRRLRFSFARKMAAAGMYFDKGMIDEYKTLVTETVKGLGGATPETIAVLPQTMAALEDEPKARFSVNADRTEVIFG